MFYMGENRFLDFQSIFLATYSIAINTTGEPPSILVIDTQNQSKSTINNC